MTRTVLLACIVLAGCFYPLTPEPVPPITQEVDALALHGSDQIIAVDVEYVEPLAMWLGLWYDTERCLDVYRDPDDVQWGLARLLISEDGWLAYGATWFERPGVPLAILIERPYYAHAGVITHEIIHALTGGANEVSPGFRCQMAVPGELELRTFPADSIEVYKRLSGNE